MPARRPPDVPSREITPASLFAERQRQRRALLSWAAAAAGTALCGASFHSLLYPQRRVRNGVRLPAVPRGALSLDSPGEPLTPYENVTTYNNFYEFGGDKYSPSRRASTLQTRPWTVRIEGEVHRPLTLDLDHFLRPQHLEERVYRLRCVEAWSMVIPWIGLPLRLILDQAQPTSHARYVAFTTKLAPEQMPEQRGRLLPWPYCEGLRLDEAMHPLTLLAVGLYGEVLPAQNGAPLRLVVPWKYGFKSIKSIVHIRLQRERPATTWTDEAPGEYGFFANVNPQVHHPRWRQDRERRLGELGRRRTLPFNGYAEQVAGLYAGMDLQKDY